MIPDFTGISAPYEAPEAPDLTITTQGCTVADSAEALIPALLRLSALADLTCRVEPGDDLALVGL